MTITCRFCSKSLRLEDMTFAKYEARRVVETVGYITVEKKGQVVADKIHTGGGLVVRGKIKGNVQSHGPVLVGPEAEIKGNVTAPSIAIGAGAVLEGQYNIRPANAGMDPPAAAGGNGDGE